ncbi:unnamed protein product [Arctia plantaginis]|uniref:Uncharacterized protein n=1 Tax=Arctia plantaginis TaxID=874455 RepID=A0A8S1AAZ8_ARCPL|nr:unnamed protein product [Arctia plantaginis]CAB3244282.1 unnamed protein product [Arctia plantaginis]
MDTIMIGSTVLYHKTFAFVTAAMDKVPTRYKAKNKKAATNAKPKSTKKRKSDGPTCSMFLADLSRRLALKKREDEYPRNIVQSIIESITNALPIKFSKKSPPKTASPMRIETLQTFAPELLPNDTLNITLINPKLEVGNDQDNTLSIDTESQIEVTNRASYKMPKMPVVNSEVLKVALEKKKRDMIDKEVNTGPDQDVASEISKYVNTLKKISLIAEEFNQKTAKNLREIVDSVQEDLIKKLEEIQAEQQRAAANKTTEIEEEPLTMEQGVSNIFEEKD